jgi:hypothetical protein
MHVDLHLQHSIKKRCLYVHLVDLPIHGRFYCKNACKGDEFGHGGKSFVKFHSIQLRILICIDRAICLTILLDAHFFVKNIHLHLTLLRSFRILIYSYTLLAMSEFYAFCIAAFHLFASLNLNASHKFKVSLKNATLTFLLLWMWFFYHFSSGCHSLVGFFSIFAEFLDAALGGCTVYYVWEPRAFMTPPENPLVYERLYV